MRKELDSFGNVVFTPTPLMRQFNDQWVSLRGRRHNVNTKKRSDAGRRRDVVPLDDQVAGSRVQIATEQHVALKSIHEKPRQSESVILRCSLDKLRADVGAIELSNRARSIQKQFAQWTQHRVDAAKKEHNIRFALSVSQEAALRRRKDVTTQHRRDMRRQLKSSVQGDVQVFIGPKCGATLRREDVPAPFGTTRNIHNADLVVLPTLASASNFHQTKGKPSLTVMMAVLSGKRVTTPAYIRAVATASRNDGPLTSKLPPSIKFTSMVTATELHLLLDGVWLSEHPSTVATLKLACGVTGSKVALYSFEKRVAFMNAKSKADIQLQVRTDGKLAKAHAAAKKRAETLGKDFAKPLTVAVVQPLDSSYQVLDSLDALVAVVRHHSKPDRDRSTHGKYVPHGVCV